MEYKRRIMDDLIDYYSSMVGCLYIKGPLWVGKTTTATMHAKTTYRLGVERHLKSFNLLYDTDPDAIFAGQKPILFDEWQMAPYLFDEIRDQVDLNGGEGGQFLITGSKELDEGERERHVKHTGTGRFFDLVMRPMSLFESGESNGKISLMSLFDDGYKVTGLDSDLSLERLIFATCRGGWPKAIEESDEQKALHYVDFVLDRLINGNEKIHYVDGISATSEHIDPQIMRRMLKSYSRNISTLVSNSKILAGVNGKDIKAVTRRVYDAYKKKLEDRYLIEDVESWCPSFKSRANVSTSEKKCFVDPSIAVSSLGLSVNKLLNDPIDFGFFYENLCMRDLRVYSSKALGRVNYYHDRSGNEVDAVVILNDGRYALVECKLGFEASLAAAEGLLKIKGMIEEHNSSLADKSAYMELPSSLIVLHGGKKAITLPNGVHLVPIGSLRD